MSSPQIDLVYFDGCPNATTAREHLREAIEQAGADLSWSEWDLMAESTPERFRKHGSPTVLVDGTDVTGDGAEVSAMACRADGAPSVSVIAASLAR